VAESPAARRERIAEMIYAAMIGSSEWRDNTAVLAHEARRAADVFLAHAPEQPQQQQPADGWPTLLEAAKEMLACIDSGKGTNFAAAMLRAAFVREEARRG
jgi:hypothetical protein